MDTNYKRTVAGSVGAGLGAIFNASGRTYYILEHKTNSMYHHAGESQKIIVDQIELGRDSSCQVRFDETFETVSRRHAAIVREGENCKLIQLSTTNATFVNGIPIQGERILSSGDEIRLSSQGPVMGFIMPQGPQSMVKSIRLTERMNLFRQQALKPYKQALWIMAIVLVSAVSGLVIWNVQQANKFGEELNAKQQQIEQVQSDLKLSDELINALNDELESTKNNSAVERARIKQRLRDAEIERKSLIENAKALNDELKNATDVAAQAGYNVQEAAEKIEALEQQLKDVENTRKKELDEMRKSLEEEKKKSEAAEAKKRAEAEARAKERTIRIYADESSPSEAGNHNNGGKVLKKY